MSIYVYLLVSLLLIISSTNAESVVEHVLETYDLDGDMHLSKEEFAEYFFTIFPNLNVTEEDEEHHEEEETSGDGHVHVCESMDELFEELDVNNDGLLNTTSIQAATDVILVMLLENCDEISHDHGVACDTVDIWLSWIYALGSAAVICLLSLAGVVLLPLKGNSKQIVMRAFLGLAIGALVGDAIIHILPSVFGAHSHGHEEETVVVEMSHLEEALVDFILPGSIVAGSIFFFYFLEVLIEKHTGGRGHLIELASHSGSSDIEEKKVDHVAYMIIVLDAIHNAVDGLALGTAFITSPVVGFATALAIILHELPQELGDFAVLIWAGLSRKQAILFNLLSSLTAIVGTVIGLLLGESAHALDKWILAGVAGSFLYIALGELLPHLSHEHHKNQSKLPSIILMAFGMLIMVGLSFIEIALEVECTTE